jgi:hypothetical protein
MPPSFDSGEPSPPKGPFEAFDEERPSAPAGRRRFTRPFLVVLAVLALFLGWRCASKSPIVRIFYPYGECNIPVWIEQTRPLMDALEAYHRKHGEYPLRLDTLVPDYIPALPNSADIHGCRWITYIATARDGTRSSQVIQKDVTSFFGSWPDSRPNVEAVEPEFTLILLLLSRQVFAYSSRGDYSGYDIEGTIVRHGWAFVPPD